MKKYGAWSLDPNINGIKETTAHLNPNFKDKKICLVVEPDDENKLKYEQRFYIVADSEEEWKELSEVKKDAEEEKKFLQFLLSLPNEDQSA